MDAPSIVFASANLLLGVVAGALAVVVGRGAAGRVANRWLAAYLAVVSLNAFISIAASVPNRWLRLNAWLWIDITFVLFVGVYLAFVGRVLPAPIVRPFRTRWGTTITLGASSALGVFLFVIAPEGWVENADGTWAPDPVRYGWVGALFLLVLLGAYLLTLVAAILSFRAAPRGSVARRRAAAYLVAFGTQDVGFTASIVVLALFPGAVVLVRLLASGPPSRRRSCSLARSSSSSSSTSS